MNKKEDEDIMLDTSYYEKADEIMARHTREERSLIPIIQDIQEEYEIPATGTSDICGKTDRDYGSKGVQRGKFLSRIFLSSRKANMSLKSVMEQPVM